MPWGLVALAAADVGMQLASGIFGASQQRAAGRAHQAWAEYNANMALRTAENNAATRNQIALFNAKAALASGDIQAQVSSGVAAYNAGMIQAVTRYNDLLLQEDLSLMWEQNDLDLKLLEQQRARERGALVANQGASGTVIGEGSNADVIVAQKTQEALDAFVMRHSADIKAAKIMNARAQNLWQGEVAAEKTMWEGHLGAAVSLANSRIQAASGLVSERLSSDAAMRTAWSQFQAGMYGGQQARSALNQQAQNTFVDGLFGAGKSAISSAYQYKIAGLEKQRGSLIADEYYTPGKSGIDEYFDF